jgi:outer membrane receptor protein involved in Fe transport
MGRGERRPCHRTRAAPSGLGAGGARGHAAPALRQAAVLAGRLLLVSALLAPPAAAQEPSDLAVVRGVVTDTAGAPVSGVAVSVEGTDISSVTNEQGEFRLAGVPSGPRVLRARRLGYAMARVPVTVPPGGELRVDIRLAVIPLMLEQLVVTADASGRAQGENATASVIEIDAIRHQTAVSLRGVLELVPGVELEPPSLGEVQQFALRATATSGVAGTTPASALAAFGTLIVLDGVPLSNNANLQTLGPRGEIGFATSAGGGIDLRRIPASTLERVEVIRGIPSVRYGDLTQGAVVVDTRVGAFEPEVRLQYDALTLEATAVGGWDLSARHGLNANFDFGRTRSSPGVTRDYANRFAGQLRHAARSGAASAGAPAAGSVFDTRLDFYYLDDDRPEDPNTRPGYVSHTQDGGLQLSERARFGLGAGFTLTATASLAREWQRSFASAERSRGAMPFTDRLTPGRSEGWYVLGPYTSELEVDGDPWLAYLRGEAEGSSGWLGLRHALRAGLEYRREWNDGAGYQFDMEFPPQILFNGVEGYDRPRSFDEIPALGTSALYVDDRAEGAVGGVGYALQLGLRLDVLHEGDAWVPEPRDAVLQPRLFGELSPLPWLRLRGGWGRTAKVPSLAELYPAPQYNDVVNVNWFANVPEERLAVLTTFVYDPANPDLGLSEGEKAEAGVEVGRGDWVVSLVAFRDRIEGGVGIRQDLTYLLRDHYQLTDSITGNGIPPEIIEPPSSADTVPIIVQRPANHLDVTNEGFELVATLPEIPLLRTRLQVLGSWVRTDWKAIGVHVGTATRFSDFQMSQVQQRAPYWLDVLERGEKRLITYRLIHHQPALGLVVTATIQHNLKDFLDDVDSRDTLAFAGYVTRDARSVPVPEAERGLPEYQDLRVPRGGLIAPQSTPPDWMLGLQVSKALPLEGELRFWAYNALDRVGRYAEAGEQPRLYGRVQFGVELNLRPGAIVRGWR